MKKKLTTGQKIRLARVTRFMSQKQAAAQFGVSPSAWSQYEADMRMPRDTLKPKIAEFCGESVQSLFFAT